MKRFLILALAFLFLIPAALISAPPETAVVVTPAVPGAAPAADLMTLSFQEADIQSVFRVLAMKGNVNIVAGPEVIGTVTIQLENVPWENAFETIVRVQGYAYEKEGNIYYVMTPDQFRERRASGTRTEVVALQYAEITQITTALQALLLDVRIQPVAGMNSILITATPSNLEAAQQLIASVDQRQPQVYIDTKIVSTALTKNEQMGINWNVLAGLSGSKLPVTFPFAEDPSSARFGKFLQRFDQLPVGQTAAESTVSTTSGGGQNTATSTDFGKAHSFPFVQPDEFEFGTIDFTEFRAVFSMIESRANTKVISNPRIVVLNHQTAQIQVGEQIGIPTLERNAETGAFEVTGFEDRNTGIVLNVTPHITDENEVLLFVRPEVTSFKGFQQITGTNLTSPQFDTIVADTRVMIQNKDTLVIGGLIDEQESDTRNVVPYLHKIPFFGKIFKNVNPSRNRTEYIFFVTVTLADDVHNRQQREAWQKKQEDYEKFRQGEEQEFFDKRDPGKNKHK